MQHVLLDQGQPFKNEIYEQETGPCMSGNMVSCEIDVNSFVGSRRLSEVCEIAEGILFNCFLASPLC